MYYFLFLFLIVFQPSFSRFISFSFLFLQVLAHAGDLPLTIGPQAWVFWQHGEEEVQDGELQERQHLATGSEGGCSES